MNITSILSSLSRAQLLALLADLSDDQLRAGVAHVAGGANGASATAAAPVPAVAPTPKGPMPDATQAPGVADKAVAAFTATGKGFAIGELAAATGLDPKSSALKSAIGRAVKAGTLFSAGDKRYARYGATAAIALARSNADRSA